MKPFRFRLESVMRYKTTLAAGEEARLALLKVRVDQARNDLNALHQLQHAVEAQTLSSNVVTGADLRALSAWQVDMKRQVIESQKAINEAETAFATQLQRVRQAKQECRLLEKLRHKRLEEWTAAFDKELEELAASSFLARWGRE